jgi:hypothetical protein
MNLLIAALVCVSGWLSQYAPGVMDRVIHNRQHGRTARDLPLEIPAVDGYIAVLDCAHIGQMRTLIYKGRSYAVLVADCAGSRGARRWMTTRNVIAEVDHGMARANGFVGRGVKAEICHDESQP